MALRISRLAKKFPQVCFRHEIRLYIHAGVIHTVVIIPTPYSLEDFIGQMKGEGLRDAGYLKLTFHFNFNLSFGNCIGFCFYFCFYSLLFIFISVLVLVFLVLICQANVINLFYILIYFSFISINTDTTFSFKWR